MICGNRSLVGLLGFLSLDANSRAPRQPSKARSFCRREMRQGAASPHARRPPTVGNLSLGAGCGESRKSGARTGARLKPVYPSNPLPPVHTWAFKVRRRATRKVTVGRKWPTGGNGESRCESDRWGAGNCATPATWGAAW